MLLLGPGSQPAHPSSAHNSERACRVAAGHGGRHADLHLARDGRRAAGAPHHCAPEDGHQRGGGGASWSAAAPRVRRPGWPRQGGWTHGASKRAAGARRCPPLHSFALCRPSCALQVFDPETYSPRTVHKYPVPVLSMAASPAGNALAVGMADGTLSVHRRRQQEVADAGPARLRHVWVGCGGWACGARWAGTILCLLHCYPNFGLLLLCYPAGGSRSAWLARARTTPPPSARQRAPGRATPPWPRSPRLVGLGTSRDGACCLCYAMQACGLHGNRYAACSASCARLAGR